MKTNILNSEQGSILVVTLIILMLMTVIGMLATNTTTTDLMIAANDEKYKRDFFVVDGGLNLESELVLSYPIILTIAEQKKHQEYYIVKTFDAGFPDDNSTDTTTLNATSHYVGSREYEYAVQFIKREQAIIKGEGARTVDVIYNQIDSKRPGSVGLTCQVYRRIAN